MRFHALAVTSIISLLGLWAASLVDSVGQGFVLPLSVLAIAGAAYVFASKKPALKPLFRNAAALAAFAFLLADLFSLSGDVVTSGTRFLAIVLVLQLLSLRSRRDHATIYAIAFFLVLAAASATASPVFLAILSLYIVFLLWGMVVLNLLRDIDAYCKGAEAPEDPFGLPLFLSVTGLSAVCIVVMLAVFFAIPRTGVGFLERMSGDPLKVSGFSERMEMDSIAGVQLDHAVVMRVETAGGRPPEPLYFRGASLDSFDGAGWSRRAPVERLVSGKGGVFTFGGPGKRTVEQKVWLEPLDTEALFAASNAYMLEGGFRNIWTDGSGDIRLPSPPFSRLEYTAWSDVSGARAAPPPDALYLDISYLESSSEGGAVTELAGAATEGRTSALGKALAIEEYLRRNYAYTLKPQGGGGARPLEDFLLRTKEGWCEHFATAMVMMLRSVGVPARIATGFLEGEWNGLGGYFIVRRQDAHSWVEAFVDGQGWKTFDPTPLSGRAEGRGAVFMYLDLMRLKWNRHIIHFSFSDQRAIAGALEARASRLGNLVAGLLPGARPGTGAVLAVLLAAAAVASAAMLAGKRARRDRTRAKAPPYYTEMLKVLASKGTPKRPEETPTEFADRVGGPDVAEITGAYLRERYGGERPAAGETAGLQEALTRIKWHKPRP